MLRFAAWMGCLASGVAIAKDVTLINEPNDVSSREGEGISALQVGASPILYSKQEAESGQWWRPKAEAARLTSRTLE